ncbi:hypothetical protein QYF36_001880 [Acer negundo]|nr:hypothetical protein QYF36_001880 [Acer negundo]
MPSYGVCDGPDEVVDLPNEVGNVDIDYEQEEEDIAADTYVDPIRDWNSLRNPKIPREECGSNFEFDCEDDDLRSLDDFDDEEVGGQPRNFSKTKYHEFDLVCDMANPIFKIGMEFGSTNVFRKAIMAHAIKRMRNIKFQKNDPNRVKAICKDKCCNWFVFVYWLGDHKTFKIESMLDAHNCAMSFKNTFVNSKMIVDRFAQAMEKMRFESVAAYEWLVDKYHVHWSREHFKDTTVCDMLCNNMCEAFSKAIL